MIIVNLRYAFQATALFFATARPTLSLDKISCLSADEMNEFLSFCPRFALSFAKILKSMLKGCASHLLLSLFNNV